MPICPICKLNYEDNIKICNDCKCELVDKLPDLDLSKPMYYDSDEAYIETLIKYLKYSKIDSIEYRYDNNQKSFCIYTDDDHEKKVNRLLKTYFENELKEEAKADVDLNSSTNDQKSENFTDLDPMDDLEDAPANYIKKADQYKDLRSSAISLIIIGVLGDLYLVGNLSGLIKIGPSFDGITSILFAIVMGTLFNIFLFGGIHSYKKSKIVHSEINEEEQLTKDILSEFTSKTADEFDANYDTDVDDGALYYNRTNYLKKQLIQKYGTLEESYLEDIIEQIYQSIFDNQ